MDMPDVAIHDADEEPGVNTESMATVNNAFRNTLADDTEDNDGRTCSLMSKCLRILQWTYLL